MDKTLSILRQVWGFESLRPLQGEVIQETLAGRDLVVVMPTGGGKSLCFQLPALVEERLTVVISPLIALMKDQVDALRVVGVGAAALNSSLSASEQADILGDLDSGRLKLLYLSPERLLVPSTMRLLRQADGGRGVARFAIDEAHCISAWGHDFRPEYRQLAQIKATFPNIPIQAFTATATPKVQRDIAIQLGLQRPKRFVGTFDRPNLTYRVVAKDNPLRRMVEVIRQYPDEGVIIYCLSRKDTETFAASLQANGIPAVAYHAGLPDAARRQVSDDFAREKANVVVATVAFGMGIDRANVRCVLHECLPKSMEGYQQETGRAGRDGLPGECILLYNHGDIVRLKRLFATSPPEMQDHHVRLLDQVRQFATSHQCRHKTLSEHFGQDYSVPEGGCRACDVCLGGMVAHPDSASIARQVLGTVSSASGRFGVNFFASVLTGSRNKAVTQRGGDRLEGFGVFSSVPTERVMLWIHQLINQGFLDVTGDQYPVVGITSEGESLLEGEREAVIVENRALIETSRRRTQPGAAFSGDSNLFERLRQWRREVAAQRGVPPYVVFHDSTLMRLAASRPSTLEALRAISGVGEQRAKDYGPALLNLLGAFVAKPPKVLRSSAYSEKFEKGASWSELLQEFDVTSGTIANRMAEWIETTRPVSIRPWVSESDEQIARGAIIDPSGPLREAFERADGKVSYDVLRIVAAKIRAEQ